MPETRLLEDARALVREVAARRAVGDGAKVLDDEDDDFVDIDAGARVRRRGLRALLRGGGGRRPAPAAARPSVDERTTVSSPPRPAVALSRSSSFASSAGRRCRVVIPDWMRRLSAQGSFRRRSRANFFFYNPNANAGERKEKKSDKEEKKKKKSAKVVDVGDGTAPVDAPKPKRDKPKKSLPAPEPIAETSPTNEDKKTAATWARSSRGLEENRDDYLAAVKALSDLGEAPPVSPPPFLHWTEYREILAG